MIPAVSMREALADPQLLGLALPGDSWRAWRTMLIASRGEPLTPEELDIFREVTGRDAPPPSPAEECTYAIGRRGGKDRAASVMAAYLAALCDHQHVLARGERGVCLCLGPDQRQAAITHNYIAGVFEQSPLLSKMVVNKTADVLSLENSIDVEVRSASFRRLRGITCVAVILTELAYFYSDQEGVNTDAQVLEAIRPSLATTEGPVVIISSPHARRGVLYENWRQHYGPKGDPLLLVARAPSRTFNPKLPQRVIDRAMERDPVSAKCEYLAEFRSDCDLLFGRDVLEQCVVPNRIELPFRDQGNLRYVAGCDMAGGSGTDSACLSISHAEEGVAVLDLVRERKPPFSPSQVIEEFAATIRAFDLHKVHGDKWASGFPAEIFAKHNVDYEPAEKTRSEFYRDFLPMVNSGLVELLDNPRLISQFASLERRVTRGGRETIDAAPGAGSHEDLANSAAISLVSTLRTRKPIEFGDIEDHLGEPLAAAAEGSPWAMFNSGPYDQFGNFRR